MKPARLVGVLVLLASFGLSSCGADPLYVAPTSVAPISNKITGTIHEWMVTISAHEAYAGDVNFTIKNDGTVPHEFIVVKTNFAPGKIPLGSDYRFDEKGRGVLAVGEISERQPGTTGRVTLKLLPGSYQVLCNLPGHYKNGMFAALTVLKKPAETIPPK